MLIFIQRFERVATTQGWPIDKWGLSLSLCLTGEALSVVGRMSAEDATDFAKIKLTLLQSFRYTEEGYPVKFQEAKPENGETGRQFSGRLLGYFDHWQDMAKTEKTYDALRDRVVSEQFLLQCDQKLAVFLKERGCKDLDSLAKTADLYLEVQGLTHMARGKEETEYMKSGTPTKESSNTQGKPHCFICNKRGHKPSDCWSKSTGSKSATGWKGKKPEGFSKTTKDRSEASCSLSQPDQHREKPITVNNAEVLQIPKVPVLEKSVRMRIAWLGRDVEQKEWLLHKGV